MPRRAFAKFLLAGVVGFLVDATIVTLLMRLAHWSPLPARAVSFSSAVTVTWLINRRHAFAGRSTVGATAEYSGYVAIQLVGAAINLGVFVLCLREWPRLQAMPAIALAAGAAISLIFNFTVSRATIYAARHPQQRKPDVGNP